MGRPKGSKNKVKDIVAGVLDVDKHNNLTRDGRKVGTVHYINDMFVAYVGRGAEFRNFDLDLLLEDIKNTMEF